MAALGYTSPCAEPPWVKCSSCLQPGTNHHWEPAGDVLTLLEDNGIRHKGRKLKGWQWLWWKALRTTAHCVRLKAVRWKPSNEWMNEWLLDRKKGNYSRNINLGVSLICLQCHTLKKRLNGYEISPFLECNFSKRLLTLPLINVVHEDNSSKLQLRAGWLIKMSAHLLIYLEKLLLQSRPQGGGGVNNSDE